MSNLPQQKTAKDFFQSQTVQEKFKQLLGENASAFTTSVLQIVNSNSLLKTADPMSIFNAAVTAASMNLPINNNLGFAWIIPYNLSYKEVDANGKDIWKKKTVAQFQIGWRGFVQLAQRTGQFKRIGATPVYKGQLISNNPLTGAEFNFDVEPQGEPIGYAAYFSLLNGFEATLFMTDKEMQKHAETYSKAIDKKDSIWKTNKPAMGSKTVLKLLLSRYAPLSIDSQLAKAIKADQSEITTLSEDNDILSLEYVDNQESEVSDKIE